MSSKNQQNSHQYSAKNIKALSPREHIRLRPGMYIGGTDKRALHHMVWAAMDHMVEEAIEGYCKHIHIEIGASNEITLKNDGLGLAINGNPNITQYMVDIAPREPIAGHYYGVQGGLHGIGLGILNALSETCTVQVRQNGDLWQQKYQTGLQTSEIEKIRDMLPYETDGMSINFKPDFSILDENEFDFEFIVNRCRDIVYLNPQLTIQVDDKRDEGQCELLYSENGLEDWVHTEAAYPIHDVIQAKHFLEFEDKTGKPYTAGIDFAFQFTWDGMTKERSFINTINTPDGGSHIEALHEVLLKSVFPETYQQHSWDDVNLGFVGAIHALHPNPQFEGRIKMKLMNPEIEKVVEEAVKMAFRQNPVALAQIREHFATHNA